MSYAFKSRDVAERLRSRALLQERSSGSQTLEEGANWEAKTPPEGIPAADSESDTIPSALCAVYYMVDDGGTITRTPAIVDGQPLKLRIGNRASAEIGGNRFISATRYVGGALIVTFDDCDADEVGPEP